MKQKLMKRILSFVLSSALLLGCATPMTAAEVQKDGQVQEITDQKGAVNISKDELDKTATVLTFGTPSSGVLTHEKDTKCFKFTVKENGYFKVKFSGKSAKDDGWRIGIYKESNLTEPLKEIDYVKAEHEFAKLAMEPGNYYIEVEATIDIDWCAPIGCGFSVQVDFTPSNFWESEGNDVITKADIIKTNTVYYGNLYKSNDEDWYKVDVTETGYIQLSFNIGSDSAAEMVNDGWNIYIYNSNDKLIRCYEEVLKGFTAPILPFSTGSYYIKICRYGAFDADIFNPVDCTYELKLASVKTDDWESEYNDKKADADTITVDKTYSAMLYHVEDVDWFKVNIDKTGYFNIQFSADGSATEEQISDGWDITVYDKNLKEVAVYSGLKESQTSAAIPYPKGTYYIKVNVNSTFGDGICAPIDCIYKLKVTQTASSVWESEENNTRAKADKISLEKTYKGIFLNGKDEDWFKFTTKSAGAVKLTFKLADSDAADMVKEGWNVYIYKNSGKNPIKELTGVTSKNSITVDLAKGTYYVKVVAADTYSEYAPVYCTYSITTNFSKAPGKVTISSITAGKKQATLKWKKTKDADGYIVYRSTSKNGTYKKVKTITKASTVKYTDKKLKSGKKYYYKVVAYNKTKGVTANAAASKIKSVKTN